MRNITKINEHDRKSISHNTAAKMGMTDAIVEKDFWVRYMLNTVHSRVDTYQRIVVLTIKAPKFPHRLHN